MNIKNQILSLILLSSVFLMRADQRVGLDDQLVLLREKCTIQKEALAGVGKKISEQQRLVEDLLKRHRELVKTVFDKQLSKFNSDLGEPDEIQKRACLDSIANNLQAFANNFYDPLEDGNSEKKTILADAFRADFEEDGILKFTFIRYLIEIAALGEFIEEWEKCLRELFKFEKEIKRLQKTNN